MSKKMKKIIVSVLVCSSLLTTGVCYAYEVCQGCGNRVEKCSCPEIRYCSNCGLRLGPGHRCAIQMP